jgi:hypothetical protein
MKADNKARGNPETGASASDLIDARIAELNDWRGQTLARVRAVIRQSDPDVVEEWKWRGVPVWSHSGIVCTGETYKNAVKLTFAKGASLEDPAGLFNASLDGNTRRAIDLHEGESVDEQALQALFRAAVALNASSKKGRPAVTQPAVRRARPTPPAGPVAAGTPASPDSTSRSE